MTESLVDGSVRYEIKYLRKKFLNIENEIEKSQFNAHKHSFDDGTTQHEKKTKSLEANTNTIWIIKRSEVTEWANNNGRCETHSLSLFFALHLPFLRPSIFSISIDKFSSKQSSNGASCWHYVFSKERKKHNASIWYLNWCHFNELWLKFVFFRRFSSEMF